jgi:hypothetical protein
MSALFDGFYPPQRSGWRSTIRQVPRKQIDLRRVDSGRGWNFLGSFGYFDLD